MENVRAFFEKEKACKSTINRMAVVKRTAEATGLSERTIRDIHKEHVARDGQLLSSDPCQEIHNIPDTNKS